MSVLLQSRNQCLKSAFGCLVVIGGMSVGTRPAVSQMLDAPQSAIIYEADEYSVQAIDLGAGHALVTNSASGIIKTLLVVQPYAVEEAVDGQLDRGRTRGVGIRRGRGRDSDPSNLVGGLSMNGSSQRIIGVICDDQYLFVAIAGIRFQGLGDERHVSDAEPIQVMLHVFDHQTTQRVLSWRLDANGLQELPRATLSQGEFALDGKKLTAYGWTFDFETRRYIPTIDPNGEEMSLPTEQTRNQMRDL